MKKKCKPLIFCVAVLLLSGCGWMDKFDGQPEMTSPCAGIDGSPCGPKRPVNLWFYQQQGVPVELS
jgi:hypothetical protein